MSKLAIIEQLTSHRGGQALTFAHGAQGTLHEK